MLKINISKIEKKEKIKVLFLIESGSRAWRWESKDSDYDIRGVFIQDYLSLNYKEQIDIKDGVKDICLWDLKKFLRLLVKSNPSCWEWLSSDIVYRDNKLRKILRKEFVKNCSLYALKKHYTSMARQNFEKYINGVGDKANLKKYVYILRSIACVLWIDKHKTPPPKPYYELTSLLPLNVKIFFDKIVKDKIESENLVGARNYEVERYVVIFFNKIYKQDKSNFDSRELNKIFKRYSKI